MNNLLAVYRREMKSYFSSQTFYIISAVFIFVMGYMFRNIFFEFATRSMKLLKYQWDYGASNLSFININVVSMQTFQYMNFILLLIVPLLTMRLYAEEKKVGTMELLMTSPITTTQILLGKFFSCFTLFSMMVILTVPFMVILAKLSHGQLDIGPVISSYAGTLLFGAAVIPIGMFASSFTENQIVAAITSLSMILGLWILIFSAQFFNSPYNDFIAYISLPEHLESFSMGFIGINHIVYYLSVSLFWLVLTGMNVESARWRQ
jgi:ABC-2 type transport system permease protein